MKKLNFIKCICSSRSKYTTPMGILILMLFFGISLNAQEACWALADQGDNLYKRNSSTGDIWTKVGSNGASDIEAIAWDPFTSKLFATNGDNFGQIDTINGDFSSIGSSIGTLDGKDFSHNIVDIDGLAFDPFTKDVWATERKSNEDLLFKINPATGQAIKDFFGPGIDFVVLQAAYDPILQDSVYDVDDLAVSPTNGDVYVISNQGGDGGVLTIINKTNGKVMTTIGYFDDGNQAVDDMEGLSFFNNGQLLGSTGDNGPDSGDKNRMYLIDPLTAQVVEVDKIDPTDDDNDFEALACFTAEPNMICGKLFLDDDCNGVLNNGDIGTKNVTIFLHRDVNSNGTYELGTDITLDQMDTDNNGDYCFIIAATGDFVITVDENDIPGFSFWSTTDVHTASFTTFGESDLNNDFGYCTCNIESPRLTAEACNDNNTPNDARDDYITFDLNPTGENLGSGYTVTVDNGGVITPTSGNYGESTSFRLQDGSADNISYTITIIDDGDNDCQVTTTVIQDVCYDSPKDWLLSCDDHVKVDVFGSGSNDCSGDPDAIVNITNFADVDSIVAEVVFKSEFPGNYVEIMDQNGFSYFLRKRPIPGFNLSEVYNGMLPGGAISSLEVNNTDNTCGTNEGLQSLVVYTFRDVPLEDVSSSGKYVAEGGYNNTKTFSIPLLADADPRNLIVKLPISELTTDNRYLTVEATSGGVTNSTTICGPDAALNVCCLNIVEVTLMMVPGSATQVDIVIKTATADNPGAPCNKPGAGQSWVMSGFVSVDVECSVLAETDWGDNPDTYGDICIDIDCGTPAFLGTIGDHEDGMQTSINADGDDVDGNDDEDGVIFVGGMQLVPSTQKTITISWSTDDVDSYISGWIDFNRNGTFDPGEKIIDEYEVGSCCGNAVSSNDFVIDIPADAICGVTYSRFIILSDPDFEASGMYCGDPTCNDGEVEDYSLEIFKDNFANAGSDQLICKGSSTTLCATGGLSFLWSTGETTQCIAVSPTTLTTYSVTVTDDSQCTDSDEIDVDVRICDDCEETLVNYGFGESCNDNDDSFSPENVNSCLEATNLYPYNGSANASCNNGIICVASTKNGWELKLTATENFDLNFIQANLLYPVEFGTAGGQSNDDNCPNNFEYSVKFFLNGTLQYTHIGNIPKDQFTLEMIQPTSMISALTGDVITIRIDGTTTDPDCDLFEIGGLSVHGCCLPCPVDFVDAGTNQTLCKFSSTTISATATGGAAPYTYTWNNGLGTGATKTVSPLVTTTYQVTIKDAKDCEAVDEVVVTVENCADIIHSKDIGSVNQVGSRLFDVTYIIKVENNGMGTGFYNLMDQPSYDTDIIIISSAYSSDAPGNGGVVLAGTGPWTLATDQEINTNEIHTYSLIVRVKMDLNDPTTPGDGIYQACEENNPGTPEANEGLFNESLLDLDDDGQAEQKDTACADLPYITHHKDITSITQTGANDWDVEYTIVVENTGGASGEYDLEDTPGFDDDIIITSSSYTSNAPGNGGSGLAGSGPWTLANDQNISSGTTHTYTLIVSVHMDLQDEGTPGDGEYTSCEEGTPGDPRSGEGLYNKSSLDLNNDGNPEEEDEACGDLPSITHHKDLTSITQSGAYNWDVVYTITVENKGGASGEYDLNDTPGFDDDITITSSSYSSNAPGNGGGALAGSGPWSLADDQNINSKTTHTYTLTISVNMDLEDAGTSGDGEYTACEDGTPGDPRGGEGLYNKSSLDLDNDGNPEEEDEACGDLPSITHHKDISSITQTGANDWDVVYTINVKNKGGASGEYDLEDAPDFDDDISITLSSYTSNAPSNGGGVLVGNGPWNLANDQNISSGTTHTYTLTVSVHMDLQDEGTPGDGEYTSCEEGTPGDLRSGEGLYNKSSLDLDNDGNPEEEDEACGDLPSISHHKDITSITQVSANDWDVVYTIVVENKGGASGEYDLEDTPDYDDDIIITSSYTSNAPGNGGSGLSGNGPWMLANDQNISSGTTHTYTLTVSVHMDLQDEGTPGDGEYTSCEEGTPGDPISGEGLYNKSSLDLNNDGNPEEEDEACGDLPSITHHKDITSITQTGAYEWNVVYTIVVENNGGATGAYDLEDAPDYDDDITITSSSYSSNAPGNGSGALAGSGPWSLADDQNINSKTTHTYTLTISVHMDLEDAGTSGDGEYMACEDGTPGDPRGGEGLYNRSSLDLDNDGNPEEEDEACGDLPSIKHKKDISSITQTGAYTWDVVYTITVENKGGASGEYDLEDTPDYDDDIIITSSSYTSNAPSNGGGVLVGNGPWNLADNQNITSKTTHTYTLTVSVHMDLKDEGTPGDGEYTSCEEGTPGDPRSGEGLYNKSSLDLNNDGNPDEEDEACGDLPNITHEKSHVSTTKTGLGLYTIVYQIKVENLGGAQGQYTLEDNPGFEDDFELLSTSYSSSAPGHLANPGPLALAGIGPWTLASNQVINAKSEHIYTLTFNVEIDLQDISSPGDEIYNYCGTNTPGVPQSGEGLFNQSSIDVNDDGEPDQRDSVCTDIEIVDLALRKRTLTTGTFRYGENIDFEITIFNQGNVTMQSVKVSDYISPGYKFNGIDNPLWSGSYPTVTYEFLSALAPGDSAKIILSLELTQTDGGVKDWINYAEIIESKDESGSDRTLDDEDSVAGSDSDEERNVVPGDPSDDDILSRDKGGEEDDHDPSGLDIFDLALNKTTQDNGPWRYGESITFDINLFNQGNIDAQNIQIVDYVPIGFEFEQANNIGWDYNPNTRMASRTYQGVLTPGSTDNLSITLKFVQAYELEAWDNYAEIKSTQNELFLEDIDSMHDMDENNDTGGKPNTSDDDNISGDKYKGEDEDDHDPHRPDVVDIALKKWIDNKLPFYAPGDVIDFTITIYNQGNIQMQGVEVKDYIPRGFEFNAGINPGWSEVGNDLLYTHHQILEGQDTFNIALKLIVIIADNPTLEDWTNFSEISLIRDINEDDRSSEEADSYPNSDADHERAVVPDGEDDNEIFEDYRNEGEDEDDHDVEKIEITGSLGDRVWDDQNGNGIQDNGEPGVEGIVVRLYNCDGTYLRLDVTNSAGKYQFDKLIPLMDYYVVFDIGNKVDDYAWTFRDQGQDDALDSDVDTSGVGPCTRIEPGEMDSTYDAGIIEYASIGNRVWHDLNGDGDQDFGEGGIADVQVILYKADGTPVAQQYTDADGFYLFDKLIPGDYYMEFYFDDKYTRTDSDTGDDDEVDSDVNDTNGFNSTPITHLSPGEDDRSWDLGLWQCISTGDFVWFDLNANGIQDPAENGINGVKVYLIRASDDKIVYRTITKGHPFRASDDGYYKFCVKPGTYYIKFQRPGYLANSKSYQGGDDEKDSDILDGMEYKTSVFTVISGDMNCDVDGGFHRKATMGDHVWYDENANGVQDNGESPAVGIAVAAYNTEDMMIWESETDINGEFVMDALPEGNYYLKVEAPTGYTFTTADAGSDDSMDSDIDHSNGSGTTAAYALAAGEHEGDIDAGLVSGVLAVDFLRFEGLYVADHGELTWEVANSINTDYYMLERKELNGGAFETVNRQKPNVMFSNEFSYNDYELEGGKVYLYRVKEYDVDGRVTTSRVVVLRTGNTTGVNLLVYPNPIDNEFNISLKLDNKSEVLIELYDELGRKVKGGIMIGNYEKGIHTQLVDVEALAKGIYILKAQMGTKEIIKRITVVR